jgi:NAD(P)-dependent dehydrogenase (short-subunit alcohol dehydrogenase family)
LSSFLQGTSALVTGGGSGLGEAAARSLAAAGSHVVVLDLKEDPARSVASSLGGSFVAGDVVESRPIEDAVARAVASGPLRVVVNCAGIGAAHRTVARSERSVLPHPLDVFKRVVDVDLVGTFNVIRLAAVAMSAAPVSEQGERGVIINTSSIAAQDGQIGQAAYAAAKAGVVGMTLPIARDLGVLGIRVNTILPGPMDTPPMRRGPSSDRLNARLLEDTIFPRRMGLAEEFGSLVMELVRNRFLNAESVRLDAGARLRAR